MLNNKDTREAQDDIKAVGQIILECLEPSTFLRGGSLSNSWNSQVSSFMELTKSDSVQKLLKV